MAQSERKILCPAPKVKKKAPCKGLYLQVIDIFSKWHPYITHCLSLCWNLGQQFKTNDCLKSQPFLWWQLMKIYLKLVFLLFATFIMLYKEKLGEWLQTLYVFINMFIKALFNWRCIQLEHGNNGITFFVVVKNHRRKSWNHCDIFTLRRIIICYANVSKDLSLGTGYNGVSGFTINWNKCHDKIQVFSP